MSEQPEPEDDRHDDLADAWATVAIDVAGLVAERDRRNEPHDRETKPVRRAA